MNCMKRYSFLPVLLVLIFFLNVKQAFAQGGGCQINLGILTPNVCVGNEVCIPFTLTNCTGPGTISLELSGPLPSAAAACNFDNIVLSATGSCIIVPSNFQQGTYCVRLKRGSIVSEAKRFIIDTIDRTPPPVVQIVQLPPIRPSYCKDDTVRFRVLNVLNAGQGYSLQWTRNDTARAGDTSSFFSVTNLNDGDFISAFVTRQNKCALNATGKSDSILIPVNKPPLVSVKLLPGFTGCENTINSFVAGLQLAGPDPMVYWVRSNQRRTDTLSQGINDTTFTLSPADSAQFGDSIIAYVVAGRCRLADKDFFIIRACGEVFVDPPLDSVACAGSVFRVPYQTLGSFAQGNTFTVQLSDSSGSFASPFQIGVLSATRPDTIPTILPLNLSRGDCYRVRILATTPADTSDTSACFKVFPRPQKPLTINDSVCGSGEVTLAASSSEPGMTFNWYADPFSSRLIFTGSSRTFGISGDSIYYVSSVSPKGCESERAEVRAVSNQATPVDVGPDRSICFGTPSLQINPSIPGGIWSGILPVTENQINLSSVAAGVYRLNYQTTNQLGCLSSDSLIITIKALPEPDAGQDLSLCGNGNTQILPGIPAGGIWLGNNILTNGLYDPAQAGPGLDTVIYKITENGCDGFDTLVIAIQPAPNLFSVDTVNPSSCAVDDGSATITGITLLPSWKVRWSVNTADSSAFPTLGGLGGGSFSVVITDTVSGCSRAIFFSISDPGIPLPVITGVNSTYCNSDSCQTITVSPTSPAGFWSGTGVTGIEEGVARFCPASSSPGTSSISYQYDTQSGCIGSTTVTFTVNQAPLVNAGVFIDTLCSDSEPVQLTGFSPSSAIWTPQPLVSPTGVFNPGLAVAGDNELTLTVNASNGCSRSVTRNMVVAPAPTPVVSRDPLTQVCLGQQVTLSVNPGNGVVVRRIEWQRDGQVIAGQNGLQLIVTEPGSYKAIITGAGECGGESAETTIQFNGLPPNEITVNGDLNPCSNKLSTLLAPVGSGFSYQWYSGNDSIPGAVSSSLTPNLSGQYRVRVRNSTGCEVFSDFSNLTIRQAPDSVHLSPLGDTCLQQGQSITISVSSLFGETFKWFRQGSPDIELIGQITNTAAGINTPGRYFAVINSSNGCQINSDTIQVLGTTVISVVDTIILTCLGDNPFQINGFSPGDCPLYYNGTTLQGNLWNPNQVGEFILTYECTNANGCVSRKNIRIRVSQPPEANLIPIGPTNICLGDSVKLQVNNGSPSGFTYQLYRNGNPYRTPFLEPSIHVNESGEYQVEVRFNRCIVLSNKITVNVRPIPPVSAGSPLSVCGSLNTNMNNQPGVTPGIWSGSPRVVTGGQYNSDNFTGCDTLTLTVSQNGCSASADKIICIKPQPVQQAASLNASSCSSSDGKAWIINGPASGIRYVWKRAGKDSVLSQTDSLLNVRGGAYRVTITDSSTLCSIVRNIEINTPNNLSVSIEGLPDSVCFGTDLIQLTGILEGLPSDSGIFASVGNRIIDGNVYDPSIPGPLVDTIKYTASLNGCVATASRLIKVNRVVVDAGSDKNVCFGDTIILKALQPANVPLSWQGPQISGDSLFVANNSAVTTALVRFSYSLKGCTASDSLLVTVNPIPNYSVTPQDVSSCGVCDGGALREMSNSSQFQTTWREIPSNSIIGSGASINNRCVGAYSVQVVNNTTGCDLTKTFGITGPTNLNPFDCLLNVPTEVCQGAGPIAIGKCNPAANIFIAGVDTDTLRPASFIPGDVQIQLVLTDQNGCTGVQQASVPVRALPVISVNGTSPGFVCTAGNPVQLANFFPPYDASNPLNGWTATGAVNGFISKDGLITPGLITNDAVIPLTYTVSSGGQAGCTASKNFQFRVNKNPVSSILPATNQLTICQGQDTLLKANPSNPAFTYKWKYSANQQPTQPIGFNDSLNASLQGQYALEISNNGCVSNTSVIQVNVTPAPVILSVGPDTTICISAGGFSLPNPVYQGNPTQISWQPSGTTPAGFITALGFVNPGAVTPGVYPVKFVASQGQGLCSDEAIRVITVLPDLIGTIANPGSRELCQGQCTTLVCPTTGSGITYRWYRDGIEIPNSNNDSIEVCSSGVYKILLSINGNAACSVISQDQVDVQVKPSPVVVINGNPEKTICFPGPPIIIADDGNPYDPADAVWSSSVPGVITSGGFLRPDSIQNQGVIDLVLTKTIGNCTAKDTLKLKAFKSPDANFQSSAGAICTGDVLKLTYSNPGNFNTVWLGVLASNPNDTSILAVNVDSLIVIQQGTYTLQVKNNKCEAVKTAFFEVKDKPVFSLPPDTIVCKNSPFLQFEPRNPSEGLQSWSGPGINQDGKWDPSDPSVPESGIVSLTFTLSSSGCVTSKSFNIDVGPVPVVSVTSSRDTTEVLQPVELRASGGVAFNWSPSEGLSATSGPFVKASIEKNMVDVENKKTYTVQVTSAKGCKAEKSIDLYLDDQFQTYNAFSPQTSKGKNDLWEVKNIKLYPDARVRIYNRWGNMVFESKPGYPDPWDGTDQNSGNPLPPGAYYFIIEPGSGLTPYSGSITLIR